jgi:hypothetical protein
MEFTCPVCERTFSRAQDRTNHINLKRDQIHENYARLQSEELSARFVDTVEAAVAATSTLSTDRLPVHERPSVQFNDVEMADLPPTIAVFADSDIEDQYLDHDGDADMDEEGSIASSGEEVEDAFDELTEEELAQVLSEALSDAGVKNEEELFNFLPDIDEEGVVPGPSEAEELGRHRRRTLIDDAQQWTWQWDESAGKVLRYEDTIHSRWRSLFSDGDSPDKGYLPFNSRLDWEIAQWAVKEDISQTSLNNLLEIPQVLIPLYLI